MTASTTDEQDALDMARLREGHDAALSDLMARHGERLFHYLIRQVQSEVEAADLAQEAFVRVYQNGAKFDSRKKFSTWLYAIATNLSRDRLRWRSRHPQVSFEAEDERSGTTLLQRLADPQLTPDQRLESEERAETIRKAVAALPEELRTPMILAEYEGRSQAEIAAILNCSPKAVEMRIYRARARLRGDLEGLMQSAHS
jgi:RNA polymerase sigma-70 factor (ECF subfamily)